MASTTQKNSSNEIKKDKSAPITIYERYTSTIMREASNVVVKEK